MSVLFLPPPSASSIPDASETVSGKIRIATSAEATAGTDDLTAITPLKLKSVVDAAVVGGVTYQGTFDASAPLDLSNAEQGDLYVINGAGSYQGQTWAVGDHLLVNADMGGTVSPSKIDKIDSTDSVTSVAGKTGAVTLVAGDVGGLATVATTGAYSDLSGTPTLATVATTGAYSDLTGTPTLGTAAAEDVGTSAGNVVQLDGAAKLPAVDGSLLTGITATVAALNDVGDVNAPTPANTNVIKFNSTSGDWESGAVAASEVSGLATVATTGAYSDLSGAPTLATVATTGAYSDLSGTPTLGTAAAEDVGTSAGNVVQLDGAAKLPAVDGSQLTNLPSGSSTLGGLTDVTITSVTDGQFLKYDSGSSQWINSNSGLYEGTTITSTSTLSTPNQPKTLTVRLSSGSAQTMTLPTGSSSLLGTTVSVINTNSGVWTISPASGQYIRGLSNSPTLAQDQALILTLIFDSVWYAVAYEEQGLGSLTDVDVTGAVATNVLKYDGTNWVDGVVAASEVSGLATVATTGAYSDLSGTPTLATVATTGAYSDLSGTPTLATVATTGAYSDLSGKPTNVSTFTNDAGYLTGITGESVGDLSDVTLTTPSAGQGLIYNGTLSVFENATITATVSALNDIGDVSAAAPNNGDVIAYNSTSGDWEATAQSGGGGSAPSVTVSSPSSSQTLTSPSGIEEVYIYTPTTAITINLVAAATCGSGFKYQIKNMSSNVITIDPNSTETVDGSSTFSLGAQYESVTLITDGSNWFVI